MKPECLRFRGTKCIKILLSEASKDMQNTYFVVFPYVLRTYMRRKIALS